MARIAGMLRSMRQDVAGVAARSTWRALVAAIVVLAAGSCGGPRQEAPPPQAAPAPPTEAPPPGEPARDPGAPAGEPGDIPAPPDVAAPPKDARTSPKGVFYKVLVAGKGGPRPTAQDTVKVHYTGWTTDGKMFDSSVTRGQPAEFPLHALIPGWTDAIPMISVGDKARFWIPEALAYKGQPGRPQGMLVFDVELLAILPAAN